MNVLGGGAALGGGVGLVCRLHLLVGVPRHRNFETGVARGQATPFSDRCWRLWRSGPRTLPYTPGRLCAGCIGWACWARRRTSSTSSSRVSGSVLVAGQGDHPGHRPVLIPDPGRSHDVLVHARVRTPRRRVGAGSVEEVVVGVAGAEPNAADWFRHCRCDRRRSPMDVPGTPGRRERRAPHTSVTRDHQAALPLASPVQSKSPGTAPRAIPLHHGPMQTTHDAASQMLCLPL